MDGREPFFGRAFQFGAPQHKAPHRVVVGLCLFRGQGCGVHGLVLGVEPLVRPQGGPESGDPGQGGVVGGAQLGGVGHGVEVRDRAPCPAQPLGGHVQRAGHGPPVGGEPHSRDRFQRLFGGGQQGVQCGFHVGRLDCVKAWQARKVQQGVGVGGGGGCVGHAVANGR